MTSPSIFLPQLLLPLLLLLFFRTKAALAAGSELGDPNQNAAGSPSSDLCEAGHYVSADCNMGQAVRCCPCPPDSFLAHPNRAQSCSPCTQCREDQEMVSDCTPTRDRKCQCKSGEFYCDSEDCLEGCHRCTSCPGATLLTCNATRDTVCAPAAQPEPGLPAGSLADSFLIVSVVVLVAIGIAIACWGRRATKRLIVNSDMRSRYGKNLMMSVGLEENGFETRDQGSPGSRSPAW